MKLYQKLLVGSLALTLGLGNLYAMEGQSLPCMSHGPDVNRALPYEIPGGYRLYKKISKYFTIIL